MRHSSPWRPFPGPEETSACRGRCPREGRPTGRSSPLATGVVPLVAPANPGERSPLRRNDTLRANESYAHTWEPPRRLRYGSTLRFSDATPPSGPRQGGDRKGNENGYSNGYNDKDHNRYSDKDHNRYSDKDRNRYNDGNSWRSERRSWNKRDLVSSRGEAPQVGWTRRRGSDDDSRDCLPHNESDREQSRLRAASPLAEGTDTVPNANKSPGGAGGQPFTPIFPYPSHDDNLQAILLYLKNHYALEPEEVQRGVETMAPEDVLGLAQCFYIETYRAVRRARDVAGVGRAGFTERDPDMHAITVPNDTECDRAPAHTLSADTLSFSHTMPPPVHSAPLVHTATPTRIEKASAHLRSDSAVTLESFASKLPGPPPDPCGGIRRQPLRDLMPRMRSGSMLCKHVEKGRPHLRFFRVEDHMGTYRGERALMPHFVWTTGATNRETSAALNLMSLTGVYMLVADSTGEFRKLFRRSRGVVVDHIGRSVANGMCAVFRFEKRDVAVTFLTEEDRQLWAGGMMGVVERNRALAMPSPTHM